MQNNVKRRTPGGTWLPSTFTAGFIGLLAFGCVGSEPGEQEDVVAREPQTKAPPSATIASADSVRPHDYIVFDPTVDSEDPRKVTIRLLVMAEATRSSAGKTLRVALDSLARNDSSLAAARAVLYVGRSIGARELELYPVAWGEWVPPEGWASATVGARNRLHRTFVYSGYPEWAVGYTPPAEERSDG